MSAQCCSEESPSGFRIWFQVDLKSIESVMVVTICSDMCPRVTVMVSTLVVGNEMHDPLRHVIVENSSAEDSHQKRDIMYSELIGIAIFDFLLMP